MLFGVKFVKKKKNKSPHHPKVKIKINSWIEEEKIYGSKNKNGRKKTITTTPRRFELNSSVACCQVSENTAFRTTITKLTLVVGTNTYQQQKQ